MNVCRRFDNIDVVIRRAQFRFASEERFSDSYLKKIFQLKILLNGINCPPQILRMLFHSCNAYASALCSFN